MRLLPARIISALGCPYCNHDLVLNEDCAVCRHCNEGFHLTDHGQLDFRLNKSKTCKIEFDVGLPLQPHSHLNFQTLGPNTTPDVDYSGIMESEHMPRTLMTHIPRSRWDGAIFLNIGCGNDNTPRVVAEHAGYEYLGVDIASAQADLLCDGHALPLKDEVAGVILSTAVLQYIQYPAVLAREIRRVLKPGGKLLGTVAFLEPYTTNSFYHYTHLGVLNTFQSAGLKVDVVAPSQEWDMLAAQASMMLFPKMPFHLSKVLVAPLRLMHKLWWSLGAMVTHHPLVCERNRILYGTGAFVFIASK